AGDRRVTRSASPFRATTRMSEATPSESGAHPQLPRHRRSERRGRTKARPPRHSRSDQSSRALRARDDFSHGKSGGAILFFVACSNANASAISFGSLHAVPVKLTLNGVGLGSKPAGNAVGPLPAGTGTKPYGTVTVG